MFLSHLRLKSGPKDVRGRNKVAYKSKRLYNKVNALNNDSVLLYSGINETDIIVKVKQDANKHRRHLPQIKRVIRFLVLNRKPDVLRATENNSRVGVAKGSYVQLK